jgi:flagellar capping protein FliD
LEKEFESAKKNAQLQASQDASREKTLNKEIADLKAKVSALDANLKQKDKEYQTRLKQVAAGVRYIFPDVLVIHNLNPCL